MPAFRERLLAASRANRSLLCIGLDPDPALMPVGDTAEFNLAIIDATKDLVCAYKPNLAFYEALGIDGLRALEQTVSHIRATAPGVVVLGDAKRGDIGSTNERYARAMFEVWEFDAATVNCYAGGEALEPFLEYEDRGVFVWCRSSNPGAVEFQDLKLTGGRRNPPLYEWVAERAVEWDRRGNVGLVVGATYPDQLEVVRSRCPGMPILAPGVGAQAGELEASVKAGVDGAGRSLIINSSRSILYASKNRADFSALAREAALNLRDRVNRTLDKEGKGW